MRKGFGFRTDLSVGCRDLGISHGFRRCTLGCAVIAFTSV